MSRFRGSVRNGSRAAGRGDIADPSPHRRGSTLEMDSPREQKDSEIVELYAPLDQDLCLPRMRLVYDICKYYDDC